MFAQRSLSGLACLLAASLLLPVALPVPAGAQSDPAARAAKQKRCPPPQAPPTEKPPIYVRVTGVSCKYGYALARKVKAEAPKGCMKHTDARHAHLTRPCRASGFRCTARPILDVGLEATCTRRAQRVIFQAQY